VTPKKKSRTAKNKRKEHARPEQRENPHCPSTKKGEESQIKFKK